MNTWQHAALLATLSGLSLPIGAVLGIILSPVRDVVCAAWVAFGAGALLFAVTVELYGHDLRELKRGRLGVYEMAATILGAFAGALIYLSVNRWLEEAMEEDDMEAIEVVDGGIEDIGNDDVESDAATPLVGGMATEHTPFLPKSPDLATKMPRTRFAQMNGQPEGFAPRDESFAMTYNAAFNPSRNASFANCRYPSACYSRNASFAFSESSFRSRGRDKAINMMAVQSSRCASMSSMSEDAESRAGESNKEVDQLSSEARAGNQVAFGLFLGLLVDGVPEGILMGCLAAEGHLSEVLVISLLVANFPEAFSSASLMVQGGISIPCILSMWTGLCVMVGVLAGISCYTLQLFFPTYPHGDLPHALLIAIALIEGITGGAMICCIATVMLPEAFARAGGSLKHGSLLASSGFLCTAGFLTAVTMKAFEHHYYESESHHF